MSLVDTQLILSIVDGDLKEAANLVTVFFDSTRQQIAQLIASCQAGDRVTMSRAAHQMAGAAGTCGFSEIEKRFRAIEMAVERMESLPDGEAITRLEDLLRQAEAEARAAFSMTREGA